MKTIWIVFCTSAMILAAFAEGEQPSKEEHVDESGNEADEADEADWEDPHVTSLADDTFEQFVKNHDGIVLVEFYATWCHHCQMFRETFANIAEKVADEPRIKLAKVEATKNAGLAQAFEIEGFPTLRLLSNGEDLGAYEGDRSEEAIIRYLKRHIQPAVTLVKTAAEVKQLVDSGTEDSIVAGLFASQPEWFTEAAKALRLESRFLVLENSAEFSGLDAADGNVIAFTITPSQESSELGAAVAVEREIYDGEPKAEALQKFIRSRRVPLFGTISPANFEKYAATKLPIMIVLQNGPEDHKETAALVQSLAPQLRSRGIVSATIDTTEVPELPADLGYTPDQVPIIVLDYSYEHHFLYGTRQETAEGLLAFVEGIQEGSIEPYRRSEPVPETNDGPVIVVVGSTFEDLVFRDDKDVLIEFYAPWCGHCKKMAPKYERLATLLKDAAPGIVVAKIDATANDAPSRPEFRIEGVPTFLLVRSDGKIISFDGSRSLVGLLDFVHEHASTPFTKPTLTEEDQADDGDDPFGGFGEDFFGFDSDDFDNGEDLDDDLEDIPETPEDEHHHEEL